MARGGQTVGNIIAARAERNYRFALGVPSFFPIPPSSSPRCPAKSFILLPLSSCVSLRKLSLFLSLFLPHLLSSPRLSSTRRPGLPFFQSPGIANNFHNSRLESFPPRAEPWKGHRPLFRSPSLAFFLPPIFPSALFLFFFSLSLSLPPAHRTLFSRHPPPCRPFSSSSPFFSLSLSLWRLTHQLREKKRERESQRKEMKIKIDFDPCSPSRRPSLLVEFIIPD